MRGPNNGVRLSLPSVFIRAQQWLNFRETFLHLFLHLPLVAPLYIKHFCTFEGAESVNAFQR